MDSRTEDGHDAQMRDFDQRTEALPSPRARFVCPICGRVLGPSPQGAASLPRFFPFCSERCKLVDLGAWFDADYRIAAKPDEDSEESADADPRIHPQHSGE